MCDDLISVLKFDEIPLWGVLVICFGGGLILALVVWFVVAPYIRRTTIEGKVVYGFDEIILYMKWTNGDTVIAMILDL